MSKKSSGPNGPIYWNYDRFYNQNTDKNAVQESLFWYRLTEIAVSRFVWTGVPPEIDIRYVEQTLHHSGVCFFWFDDKTVVRDPYYKFFCLAASPADYNNCYNNPTSWTVAAPGTITRQIPDRLGVAVWSSQMRVPDAMFISQYVERLTRIDSVIQTNIETQRHPFVIAVDEDERHTIQQAYRQVKAGEPVIWGTPSMAQGMFSEKVSALNLQVPSQQVLDMLTAKARIWNECMTFMGIENANTDKKERMISNEVASNNGQISMFRKGALLPRQHACEQINAKFGLNMWCEWNEELTVPEMIDKELGGA